MKGLLIIGSFCLALLSCQDEPGMPIFQAGDQAMGWAVGLKNGSHFMGSPVAAFFPYKETSYDSLSIKIHTFESYDGYWLLRETISFYPIPMQVGRYKAFPAATEERTRVGSSYDLVADDGHVLESYYLPLETKDNWIELTEVDTVKGILQGKINCTYQKTEQDLSPNPDVCSFKDLRFAVRYPR